MYNIKTFEKFSLSKWIKSKIHKKIDINEVENLIKEALLLTDLDFKLSENDDIYEIIFDKNLTYERISEKIRAKQLILNLKDSENKVKAISKHLTLIEPGFNYLYLDGVNNIKFTQEILDSILFIISYICDEFNLSFDHIITSFKFTSIGHNEQRVWTDLSLKVCDEINCFEDWVDFNLEHGPQIYSSETFGYPEYMKWEHNADFNSIVISFKKNIF